MKRRVTPHSAELAHQWLQHLQWISGAGLLICFHHIVRHLSVTHNLRKSPVLRSHSFAMQLSQTFQKLLLILYEQTQRKGTCRGNVKQGVDLSRVPISDLSRFAHYWLFLPPNLNHPHPLLNLADFQGFFFLFLREEGYGGWNRSAPALPSNKLQHAATCDWLTWAFDKNHWLSW